MGQNKIIRVYILCFIATSFSLHSTSNFKTTVDNITECSDISKAYDEINNRRTEIDIYKRSKLQLLEEYKHGRRLGNIKAGLSNSGWGILEIIVGGAVFTVFPLPGVVILVIGGKNIRDLKTERIGTQEDSLYTVEADAFKIYLERLQEKEFPSIGHAIGEFKNAHLTINEAETRIIEHENRWRTRRTETSEFLATSIHAVEIHLLFYELELELLERLKQAVDERFYDVCTLNID